MFSLRFTDNPCNAMISQNFFHASRLSPAALMTSSSEAIVISPSRTFSFSVPPHFDVKNHSLVFTVRQGLSTGGMLHTGAIVWEASLHLARWLAEGWELDTSAVEGVTHQSKTHPLCGASVLELGAGVTGLPSLVAASVGAKSVTATDLPEECVILSENVKCACGERPAAAESPEPAAPSTPDYCPSCGSAIVTIAPLDFFAFIASPPVIQQRFDYAVGGDIVYEDTLEPLLEVLTLLLVKNERTLPVAHSHRLYDTLARTHTRRRLWLVSLPFVDGEHEPSGCAPAEEKVRGPGRARTEGKPPIS